jgi:H+-transporting ATPase
VGIAVSNAPDVAKASASIVLTSAGLSGIVELVKNVRKVYQRIATWVLNKVMRTSSKRPLSSAPFWSRAGRS